jgi:putative acetyltransferase
MNPKIVIRCETDADVGAIRDVTVSAFKTLEISNHTEQFIIAALRAAKSLTVSLVAEVDGRVVGYIAFSPVTSDGTRNWYGLGPLSVLPDYQRQGVGKALIEEGLSRLRGLNAQGCCLVGHPDYYRKFGFKNMPGLVHEGVPQEVFLALSVDGHIPQGTVTCHEAFKAEGQREGAGDCLTLALTVRSGRQPALRLGIDERPFQDLWLPSRRNHHLERAEERGRTEPQSCPIQGSGQ